MGPLATEIIDVDTIYSNLKDLFSEGEFEDEILRVQREFSELIDRDTAALFIAVEAGRIQPEEVSLRDLADSEQVTISGRITRIDRIRTFTRKDGTSGRVQSLFVSNGSQEVRVSFWENRDIEHLQEGQVKEGMTIKVVNGRVKINQYGTTVNVGNYTNVTYSTQHPE